MASKDDAALSKIHCPVMGNYGEMDNRVTSTVAPTTEQMKKLGKSYSPHVYAGASHGFLRNQNNEANTKAAQEAWPATIAFLKENTK
jgi:carboxymethylenebutenolidase